MKNQDLKRRIIDISYKLKLGHIGSCLVAVDKIAEIYDKKEPDERFVLSSGHAHLAHLVVKDKDENLSKQYGIDFAMEMVKDYGIHCDRQAGCDVSTGSLGHGIGIALGMALADRTKNVYCIISDGETSEGSVWEALRIQKEQYVTNLLVYCVINGWGAYKEINSIELSNKLEYYSWCTPIHVNMGMYPKWLQSQEGHYGVLDKKRYDEVMEILQ